MWASNLHSVSWEYYVLNDENFENKYDYDCKIESIQDAFSDKFKKNFDDWWIDKHELSSYPSQIIGRVYLNKTYFNWDLEFWFCYTIVSRSGYYEWANLDYHIEYHINWIEYDIDELQEYWWWYNENFTKKQFNRACINFRKWTDKEENKVLKWIQEILKKATDMELAKVCTASNWETMYRVVK